MRGRIRIAIACAGLLATPAVAARAQSTFRETGSVTVGGYVVWVRGTSANAVQLFVGRGFRDAFARAHEMDAARLQQWVDSVQAIAPLPADDSSAADARVPGTLIGADVTILRRVGGPFSGLRLLVNGEEPITMAEPTARDFIAALDSAAHAAHELTPVSVMAHMLPGDAPLPEAPLAVAASAPASHPALARAPAPASAPASHPAPAPAPAPVLSPPPAPAIVVASHVDAPPVVVASGPTTSHASPDLVLPAPSEPVLLLASGVDLVAHPLPAPVVPKPIVVAPPLVVDAPVGVAAPPTLAPDIVVPPHPEAPADKLIHTPLGPFTVPGALLADRDKEAQYCYTQLGLKYNPDLKGEITVKVQVGSDGAVQQAVVTKRNWQGISAGEVESCVRALAHDWTFASTDPSVTGGAKILTFSFAPQVAAAP